MDLGEQHLCLNVKNLGESIEFYSKLGLSMVDDHSDENWAVMRHNGFVLSLFQGHIRQNLMNFRGGDIEEIGEELKQRGLQMETDPHLESDGSWSAEIHDPDGNAIYFNTYASEREKYLKDGRLIG